MAKTAARRRTAVSKSRKTSVHAKTRHTKRAVKKWSKQVTQTSDALDLKKNAFKQDSPKAIARSLKRSAEQSPRRKSDPYRSAMSMLVFYINRAGKNLPAARHNKLEAAKDELRKVFGKAA
jgi:phosphoenolpyruvate carboxylase